MNYPTNTSTSTSSTPTARVATRPPAPLRPPLSIDLIPSYRLLLRSCSLGRAPPSLARSLHAAALKSGLLPLLSVSLLHMYAALGPPGAALLALSDVPPSSRSPPEWTAVLTALPPSPRSLCLFRSMLRSAVRPDAVSLLAVFSLSARLADPVAGASAHLLFLKLGLRFPVRACNAALNMYAACGRMADARRIFGEMPQAPDVVTWTLLLNAVLKSEGLASGRELFDRMPQRNDVSWTVMITACIEAGLPREAFSLLDRMLFFPPAVVTRRRRLNHVSLCSLLSACSQAGDLTVGRWIHVHFLKESQAMECNEHHLLMVGTALINMYGKCGEMDYAKRAFETMPTRNVVAWNALLSGLSMYGRGEEVLILFNRMVAEEAQQRPDEITLVCVLTACSRSGLVDEGCKVFHDLTSVYGLTPNVEHYACMVGLLSRACRLEEAKALISEMPFRPNEVILGSLLASCALHRKLELGRSLMDALVQMDPNNTEYHVLLSNMYSSSGRHVEADRLRLVMRKNGVRKVPGTSHIQIDGNVHHFSAGDKLHPQIVEVYAMLDAIVRKLHEAGYIPDAASQISRVPDSYLENDDEREEREQALLAHSERLALSFGFISCSKHSVPLRIFKNLRICSDCHTFMKLVSDVFHRTIIIRDRNRFHYFMEGVCSCSDYW